jgi:hypothetical protein
VTEPVIVVWRTGRITNSDKAGARLSTKASIADVSNAIEPVAIPMG